MFTYSVCLLRQQNATINKLIGEDCTVYTIAYLFKCWNPNVPNSHCTQSINRDLGLPIIVVSSNFFFVVFIFLFLQFSIPPTCHIHLRLDILTKYPIPGSFQHIIEVVVTTDSRFITNQGTSQFLQFPLTNIVICEHGILEEIIYPQLFTFTETISVIMRSKWEQAEYQLNFWPIQKDEMLEEALERPTEEGTGCKA